MDVQDPSKPATPSGHDSHVVLTCHRCGWPFPNPHPSARHRRAHKKICGTVEGYTTLIDSGVVSDDEHHLDEHKEETPSPKTGKMMIMNESGGGVIGSRSEDDLFSDAVTEFSDAGTSPNVDDRSVSKLDSNKTLDRDLFFSFKEAENGGTNEGSNSPIEISKSDASLKVFETNVEKIEGTEIITVCDSTEAKLELPETDGEPSDDMVKEGSQSHEAESSDVVEAGEDKVQETRTSEAGELAVPAAVIEEAKDAESRPADMSKATPESVDGLVGAEVSVTTGLHGEDDDGEVDDRCNGEKLEAPNARGIIEEIKHEKFESDHEHAAEVVKGSEIDLTAEKISEEIKHAEVELDHEHAAEVVKELETDQSLSVLTGKGDCGALELETCLKEDTQEDVEEPDSVLNEKEDLGAPELETCSKEDTHQDVEEPDSVLTERENLGAPNLEKRSKEHTQEVLEEPDSVLTEKVDLGAPNLEKRSKEHSQEVRELDPVLTEKEDLGAPNLEKGSKEHTQEVVGESDPVLSEKADLGAPNLEKGSKEHTHEVVQEPDSVLTEREDLGAPNLEKRLKGHTQEVVEEPNLVFTQKEDPCAPNLRRDPKEHTQEAVKEPDSVSTEKADLGAPNLEKRSKEHTQEVVVEPDPVLIEKVDPGALKRSKEHTQEVVKEPNSVLTQKEDLAAPNLERRSEAHTQEVVEEAKSILTAKEDVGAPNSEECSREHTQEVVMEPKINNDGNVVVEGVDTQKITLKEAEQLANVSEPIVEEGTDKPMNNQVSGVDLLVDSSSHNSLEGNWGSVSVLSTASVDVETSHAIDKSKVDSGKSVAAYSHLGTPDVFEPPSFMTLVEPKGNLKAAASSEAQDSQQQQNSKASQAGWFPTLINVNNETQGRKRNEEVIAKVTNWSAGKHTMPLKNLLDEVKSPNPKPPATVVQTDDAATEKSSLLGEASVQDSPPKLINDGKKERKKGRVSWVPFGCCSSVNVVN